MITTVINPQIYQSIVNLSSRKRDLLALIISMILHVSVGVIYRYSGTLGGEEYGVHFRIQLDVLLFISMVVSIFLQLKRGRFYLCLTIKIVIFFLIGYPLYDYLWPEYFFALSILIQFTINRLASERTFVFISTVLGFILFQNPGGLLGSDMPSSEMMAVMPFLVSLLFIALLLIRYEYMVDQSRNLLGIMERQGEAIDNITKANIGYQSYSSTLELETAKNERNRISREVHDVVGYSLTNIRIMLEAVLLLENDENEKMEKLVNRSIEQVVTCLEETRESMRLLRSTPIPKVNGVSSIFNLVGMFKEITGVNTDISFGNSPNTFGEKIDKVVFRFIQEGLTNSFRHGRASEIKIYFWIRNGILEVSLKDNGTGSSDVIEGIGIKGMRERSSEFAGRLEYRNLPDGFEIRLLITVEETQHDTNTIG